MMHHDSSVKARAYDSHHALSPVWKPRRHGRTTAVRPLGLSLLRQESDVGRAIHLLPDGLRCVSVNRAPTLQVDSDRCQQCACTSIYSARFACAKVSSLSPALTTRVFSICWPTSSCIAPPRSRGSNSPSFSGRFHRSAGPQRLTHIAHSTPPGTAGCGSFYRLYAAKPGMQVMVRHCRGGQNTRGSLRFQSGRYRQTER